MIGDKKCNIVDVQIMAQEWLTAGTQADIEPIGGDSWVDFRDFSVLASDWLKSNLNTHLAGLIYQG